MNSIPAFPDINGHARGRQNNSAVVRDARAMTKADNSTHAMKLFQQHPTIQVDHALKVVHLEDITTRKLSLRSFFNTVSLLYADRQHRVRCEKYFSLVADAAFHLESMVVRPFGSCGHLVGRPVISEAFLRVTFDVIYLDYTQGQANSAI